ncbi:uncharacterized protein si:ch211-243a20.4 [Electrophorus electricus]|uniref:uncharacterized protein si:ch211-243a20.4 n=1 Tax=Electrophorus electricus TaxID=8005 RepID=UPI0015D01EA7|nr:uncharacterized protein si:ch211-243a20.4 [Electrophorus electricus]
MFSSWSGVFFFLLCFCNKTQVIGSISVENKTSVALAGETLHYSILFNVPANKSSNVRCFRDRDKVGNWSVKSNITKRVKLWVNITMLNSSDSGEYCFHYGDQVNCSVVLVRNVGYLEPYKVLESDVISLLVLNTLLLLFSVFGSVYVFKWHKDYPPSEKGGEGTKQRKRESNTGMRDEVPSSDSLYMSLEPRPVSIYDVLNVDETRRKSAERVKSKEPAKTSQEEQGIFESVYENL